MDPCDRKRTHPAPVAHQYKKRKDEETNARPLLDLPVLDFSEHSGEKTLLKSILNEKLLEREKKDKLDTLVNDTFDGKSDYDLFLKTDGEISKNTILTDLNITDEENDIKDENPVQIRKSVLIPPLKIINSKVSKKQNQCKYILKKKPKRGMQCTVLTDHELCTLHSNQKKDNCVSKNKEITKLREENQLLSERISKLEKNLSELCEKIESSEVKNKSKELEDKVKQLEENCKETHSKFDQILEILSTNQTSHRIDTLITLVKEFESKAPPAIVKIQKLDKLNQYKLVKKLENNYAIIANKEEENVKVKFPKNMPTPEQSEGYILKYNDNKNIFEWIQSVE